MLALLYLHGLSTGDFEPALKDLLGEDAAGLSSSSISRLTESWQADHAAFKARSLKFHRYAYLFLDGVHVSIRLGEDDKLCLLVVIGVREDGVPTTSLRIPTVSVSRRRRQTPSRRRSCRERMCCSQ